MTIIKNLYVKVGDRVKVISGKQKGFIGSVSEINKNTNTLIIKEITPRIKFIKNREGGEPKKIELPVKINISNVMLWDNVTNQASRIGYKIVDQEKKRYFKKSGNLV